MAHEVEREALSRYLEQHGLKHTKQRDLILEIFLEARRHITSDDLYQSVRAEHPNIHTCHTSSRFCTLTLIYHSFYMYS